ncbi:GNAT family N-acetyltransferase [Aquibaculum sediminis]|uniref:GNAT family N-acetyltransferase n=1 Tax=Aquibaculum sediminis TaxID=3231907 RepID=UPI0034550562
MINIRPAEHHDAAVLPNVERSSGAIFREWPGLEWIADDDVQSIQQHHDLIASGVVLVAEMPGRGVVGFVNGEFAADALHLWQVAVHHDYQRRGIGRRLIEAAKRRARQRGLAALTLTTFRQVPWNAPYYARLGFRVLEADAVNPRLKAILEREAQAGLPAGHRCAMVLSV